MARGRKQKPTGLKEANGNPGKRALNKSEPTYELTNADPPEYLPPLAAEAWKHYAPRLIGTKVLTDADLHNLEAFCMAYYRWREGEQDVIENGITLTTENGTRIKNPAVTVINEALKQLATFGAALGLDPSSRTRLTAPKGGSSNPFENL